MTQKPLRISEAALADLDGATEHYLQEAGREIAEAFADEIEEMLDHLVRFPQAGSPRWGFELRVKSLRALGLPRFPYVVFSIEHDDATEVLRVLHQSVDVPRHLE